PYTQKIEHAFLNTLRREVFFGFSPGENALKTASTPHKRAFLAAIDIPQAFGLTHSLPPA
ncbi:hypothetical protein, partial [Pseudomonas paraeruginosa]|uniref:hypothetical protein n=1 Tax=Pseudomonas paraeruginosa TaxID=2994495 RepID=UPI001F30B793